MLGHVTLTDAANVLLPGQGGRIDRSQPGWQRNEFRSRAADGCVGDRFRCDRCRIERLEGGGQWKRCCAGLEESAPVEHAVHYGR